MGRKLILTGVVLELELPEPLPIEEMDGSSRLVEDTLRVQLTSGKFILEGLKARLGDQVVTFHKVIVDNLILTGRLLPVSEDGRLALYTVGDSDKPLITGGRNDQR